MEISLNKKFGLETIRGNSFIYNNASRNYEVLDIPIIESQPVGSLLLNFLDADFSNFDSFKLFFDKFGINDYLENKTYTEEDYVKTIHEYWLNNQIDFTFAQNDFKCIVDFCLNINDKEYLRNLSFLQRYYITYTVNGLPKLESYNRNIITSFDILSDAINSPEDMGISEEELSLRTVNHDLIIKEIYQTNNILSICYIEFKELILNTFTIRKCKNCHRYFFYTKKNSEKYCDRFFKVSKNRKELTCKNVGYENTLGEIEKYQRMAYKRENGKFNRNKNKENSSAQLDYNNWQIKEEEMREKYKSGEKTFEDYKTWLGY